MFIIAFLATAHFTPDRVKAHAHLRKCSSVYKGIGMSGEQISKVTLLSGVEIESIKADAGF
jgi:hypothetical protein